MFKWFDLTNASLGPLTHRVFKKNKWGDGYPSYQALADELEDALTFIDAEKQFSSFLPRLRQPANQRDETLAEVFVAYYLTHYKGFRIVSWRPQGAPSKKGGYTEGEFEISLQQGSPVFVEVKSPGWESELSSSERKAGRDKLPKHQHGQGGSYSAEKEVLRIAKEAMGKFTNTKPNLLVICDDLRVTPFWTPEPVLKRRIMEWLGTPSSVPLGGLLLFRMRSEAGASEVQYLTYYFENPLAKGQAWEIPVNASQLFTSDNKLLSPIGSSSQPQPPQIWRRPGRE
jgi:hypothetical protein